MIARIWRGQTRPEDAEAYLEVLKRTGVPDYQRTSGNRGVIVLRRVSDRGAEFLLLTLWDDWPAIIEFAGDEFDLARYHAEDEDYLTDRPERVDHYDVVFQDLE
jgi:heme-degrading monooxygenase HmoA